MPLYAYLCPFCRAAFEERAGLDDRFLECPGCGSTAERRPFSGVPYISGETVARDIPDASYRQEAQERGLKRDGWDLDRSVRHLRKGIKEDNQGRRFVDLKGVNNV